ncbi:MAG: phosphotransferase, partial [Planctomycetales bacterium]|nr:phosphotransferase [Planctomycetales bacterium]
MPDLVAIFSQFGMTCRSAPEPLGALGGLSGAQFWRLQHGAQRLLLRRWPPGVVEARLSEIHQAIAYASARGLSFLPTPFTAADGRSFVAAAGSLWEVAPWLPGDPALSTQPSDHQQRTALAALARLHLALQDLPSRPATVGKPNSLQQRSVLVHEALAAQWLREGSLRAREQYVPQDTASRLSAAVRKWLPIAADALSRVEVAALPLHTIVGDARAEHFLFTGEELTGLVDFGALRFDSPMLD